MKKQFYFLRISSLLLISLLQNVVSAQSNAWLSEERKEEIKNFIQSTDSLVDYGEYEKALLRFQEFFDLDCNEKTDAEKNYKRAYLSHWGVNLVDKYAPALLPFISLRDEFVLGFRQGNKYQWIFTYIVSMNKILEQEDQSFLLFEEIEGENRMKAMVLWPLIKHSAIEFERYDLLEKYDFDVETEYDYASYLHKMLLTIAPGDSIIKEDLNESFKEDILKFLRVGLILKDTLGVKEVLQRASKEFGPLEFDITIDSIPFIEID
jgi:hypothetical protein